MIHAAHKGIVVGDGLQLALQHVLHVRLRDLAALGRRQVPLEHVPPEVARLLDDAQAERALHGPVRRRRGLHGVSDSHQGGHI